MGLRPQIDDNHGSFIVTSIIPHFTEVGNQMIRLDVQAPRHQLDFVLRLFVLCHIDYVTMVGER